MDTTADTLPRLGIDIGRVIIDGGSHPDGGDTAAPTTLLVDGGGTVRWTFRPDRFLNRLSPSQVLAAVDKEMPAD